MAYLADSGKNVLGEESGFMTLARIGAQAIMTRAELKNDLRPGASLIGEHQLNDRRCQRERRARGDDGPDLGDMEETLSRGSVIAALGAELLPFPGGIDDHDEAHQHKTPRNH